MKTLFEVRKDISLFDRQKAVLQIKKNTSNVANLQH